MQPRDPSETVPQVPNSTTRSEEETVGTPYPGPVRAWTTLTVLTLFYVLSLMDRNILSLLIEPIKHDLSLSDTEVSVLYGAAFAMFYAIGSLPLGWAVDRFNRRRLIFLGVTLWSLATCACGLVLSFPGLFAARASVGIGEAAIVPASQSIIADSFPPKKMSLPMTIYGAGTKLGIGVSFIIGSALVSLIDPNSGYQVPLLGSMRGWQLVFIAAGLPGILIALLIFLVPEPPRRPSAAGGPVEPLSYLDYIRFFLSTRSFMIGLHVGQMLMLSIVSAISTWAVPFLVRVHDWPTNYAGFVLGPILAVAPLLCVPIHGILVDRAYTRGVADAHMRHLTYVSLAAAPLAGVAFLLPSAWATLAFVMFAMMFTSGFVGLGNAAIQLSVPAGLRGKAASVQLLLTMLAGYTLGSSGPALISDGIFGDPKMIGVSVSIYAGLGLLLAAGSYAAGRKAMRRHLGATVA